MDLCSQMQLDSPDDVMFIEGILRSQWHMVVQNAGWGKNMVYSLGMRLVRDQREIEQIVCRLYGLPPTEITQVEGALANNRRAGGKNDDVAEVETVA